MFDKKSIPMNFLLFDTHKDWKNLLPLTYFNAIPNIRLGILKIYEKWEKRLGGKSLILSEEYLTTPVEFGFELAIRSIYLPDFDLTQAIRQLRPGEALRDTNGNFIAGRFLENAKAFSREEILDYPFSFAVYEKPVNPLKRPYELILKNSREIEKDFALLEQEILEQENRTSDGFQVIGDRPLFIDESAKLDGVYIDLNEGPVYIGKNVRILPGTYIKGPAAILAHSFIKANTSIYNGTTLGPWTKVGGEIKNVLFQGYSNKGHDGFLGDSVIGKWCNLGAGTSNSNLKNNYSQIRMWHIASRAFEPTGQMFLGTVMGDFSKTAINTRINTGTVIGVASNIFYPDFPPKFVTSFNWGGEIANHAYDVEKALETARIVFGRRGKTFDETEERIFRTVHRLAGEWE